MNLAEAILALLLMFITSDDGRTEFIIRILGNDITEETIVLSLDRKHERLTGQNQAFAPRPDHCKQTISTSGGVAVETFLEPSTMVKAYKKLKI